MLDRDRISTSISWLNFHSYNDGPLIFWEAWKNNQFI